MSGVIAFGAVMTLAAEETRCLLCDACDGFATCGARDWLPGSDGAV